MMLKDTQQVRQVLARRKEAVVELLSLLTEENRGKLLKRLGGLNLTNAGEFEAAK